MSNRKCRSGEVEIFDSAMQKEVSTTVRRQLVTMLHTLQPRMTTDPWNQNSSQIGSRGINLVAEIGPFD